MGYYTHYELEFEDAHDDEVARAVLGALKKRTGAYYTFDLDDYEDEDDDEVLPLSYETDERRKWYEFEADMRAVSKEVPGILFTLTGEGEEAGDLWRWYFLDGKVHKGETTLHYEEFDEGRLE